MQLSQIDGPDVPKDKPGDFRRLAQQRTITALDTIRKIENLSNRANYEYSPEQVQKIFETLRRALDNAEAKFADKRDRIRKFTL
ncbi:MAG TPA: hypothetical protein VMU37_10235 [Caulobacteraceae bacterium]|nr:hypothetical protein [Caulobacteraceae bacterium]